MDKKASRVLIVDDMPVNRLILSSLLATNGVLSDQVDSGSKCLTLCREKRYDLILLDHRMPDQDGVDTLVALKDLFNEKGYTIPVICHTTEEGRNNINLYKAAGFSDVLIKPIDPAQLSSVLMEYLPEKDKLADPEVDIQPLPEADDIPEDEDTRDELDKLPLWLKTVPHIDLVAGIDGCGSAEDYVDALYIFYSSIEDKAGEIEFFAENENWTMYSLRVHSLKSMARLVGVRSVSEQAQALETASKAGKYDKVKIDTPEFLASYRHFSTLLARLKDDEHIKKLIKPDEPAKEEPEPEPIPDHTRTVLFIQANTGIVTKGVEKNLEEAGFKVISIPDEPDMIIAMRFEGDIVLYLPSAGDESHIGLSMNLLGEICQDDSKILCLIGDVPDIESAMECSGAHRVTRTYARPVNIQHFIRDMYRFSDLEQEYHRRKTLFVVDDDPDYRSIIEHWLSDTYNVSGFDDGQTLLDALTAATPDLILLDYEMPGMDGYELMKNIRTNRSTQKIPIIFLTGKNDRDHVVRILEYKPDGYLLKTSQKESLLDTVNRFFSESMFRNSLSIDPVSQQQL